MRCGSLLLATSLGFAPLACAGAMNAPADEPGTQDSNAAGAATPSEAEQAEMAKAMAEAAQPGPEHEILAGMAGDWKVETEFSMGAEPMTIEATMHAEMVLGGRFLLQTLEGAEGPMQMNTVTILGFDRRHGEFTIYGCDDMGTYCVGAQGPWDATTKTMTLYGEDVDPIAKLTQKYDIVITVTDADHMQTQVIFKPGTFGNEAPLVAATNRYTRVK